MKKQVTITLSFEDGKETMVEVSSDKSYPPYYLVYGALACLQRLMAEITNKDQLDNLMSSQTGRDIGQAYVSLVRAYQRVEKQASGTTSATKVVAVKSQGPEVN